MYNDTDDTVKRIGISRSRGRVGVNNEFQRLDASSGNDDVDQSRLLSFINNFKSVFQNIAGSLNDTVSDTVNTGVEAITSLYHEAGQCMLVKNIGGRFSSQPAWWNSTCDSLKYIKFRALEKFRESNLMLDIRVFKDERNVFNNNCRYMVSQHQCSNRSMLLASSNDPISFRKILQRGKPLRTEWYQYFAGLLFDENAAAIDQSY